MAARAVVVEAQDAPAFGRNAHQPERHALADGRQVQHAAVGRKERQPVSLHKAAEPFGRVAALLQLCIQLPGLFGRQPAVNLLLVLFLQRPAVGRKDGVILLKPLHREGVVADHAQRIEHLPQPGRMPAARRRDGINQLVGDEPPGREYPADRLLRFGRHLQRRLEMGLDDELSHADGRSLLLELPEHLHQSVVDTHRQIGRQARTETHALQFGVFLAVGPPGVGLALAAGHAVYGLQYIVQRLVLAHQGVPARDKDVAQLRVFFEIGHQAAQLVVPALLGPQALELEVEPFALKIVHALATRRRRAPSCRESGSPPPDSGGGYCARRAAATPRHWAFRLRRRPPSPTRGCCRRSRPAAASRGYSCGSPRRRILFRSRPAARDNRAWRRTASPSCGP